MTDRKDDNQPPGLGGNNPDPYLLMLGRIDGKLDGIMTRIEANEKQIEKLISRVGALERWRAWLLGISAVVSAAITFLVKKYYL